MDYAEIRSILHLIGARVPPGSQLVLLGGSALALLGSPRPTIDIDFIGDDLKPSAFHQTILQIARELKVHVEAVPLERFIPLPNGNEERLIHIGPFGNLDVFVADPYSIALSKLDRGADTDFDDVVFLIQNHHIQLGELERILKETLPLAHQFDFHPDIRKHLIELKNRLRQGI
ncbi:MAG: nucleotidyl transferase AbiEii/AbiGii toxin family protein [Anaerolineales bacterium]|nr:nucleotidyl transferase AbiEii/AbiGii toxin family protein [Anaerolineales bacterium]